MIDIPVLFIIFKRPKVALQSFSAIKKAAPRKLYIACDGARDNIQGERDLVDKTRKIILDNVDWDCEVYVNFQTKNLGCASGVFTAINWLFQHEQYGIILEDDCIAQETFFPFMQELLIKYEKDERIGMIDGANYIKGAHIVHSYCFSKYKSTNGWGTWRRAWNNMDMKMKWRNTLYEESIIKNMGYKGYDYKYWKYRLKAIDKDYVSAWDWQWYFTLAAQNQLSIFPQVSLISNIGFGEGATHTTEGTIPNNFLTTDNLEFPLVHPDYVVPDINFANHFYDSNNSFEYTIKRYVPFKIKNMLKKIIR